MNLFNKLRDIGRSAESGDKEPDATGREEHEEFERLVKSLTSRVPPDLLQPLQDVVQRLEVLPTNGAALLDAIDRVYTGLGIAIGRGETGEQLRYSQLGQLSSWLYEDLGRPQQTQYAVVRKAAEALAASERHFGEA